MNDGVPHAELRSETEKSGETLSGTARASSKRINLQAEGIKSKHPTCCINGKEPSCARLGANVETSG